MKAETKVGFLFIITVVAVLGFAYVLGAFNPFSNTNSIELNYNFAGGIEVGSPVRVMGIEVGTVKTITFDPHMKDSQGNQVNLKILISVSKRAWKTVKSDSKFFINLAGVIGEKFIEITPGSAELPLLKSGVVFRGEDPPRIDQMISQSYGLAGRIIEFVEKNEGSVVETLDTMNRMVTNVDKLVVNLNKLMKQVDKTTNNKKIQKLVDNIIQITGDVASVSGKLRSKDTEKTIDLLHRLMWRLEELDKTAIRKFLQEEGIRAKIGF